MIKKLFTATTLALIFPTTFATVPPKKPEQSRVDHAKKIREERLLPPHAMKAKRKARIQEFKAKRKAIREERKTNRLESMKHKKDKVTPQTNNAQ